MTRRDKEIMEGLGNESQCFLSLGGEWAVGFQQSLLEDPKALLVLMPCPAARAFL